MFKINWDNKIEMTNQLFFMIVVSWTCCGFVFGLLLGVIS